MAKRKILMVCEAFGGEVFTYVSQLCNDMVGHFVSISLFPQPQTPRITKIFWIRECI